MKTSCISHPPKTPLVIIREEYLAICDGDHCEAAVLNQFEYWTNVKLGYQEQAEIESKIAHAGGIEIPPSDLWIYKTQTELHEELMGLFGIRAVGAALQSLVDRGFLERRNNPKYAWDRTYQYRLETIKVQDAILQLCKIEKSRMQDQKGQESDIESSEDATALPETTIEITPKETTEKENAAFPKTSEPAPFDAGIDLYWQHCREAEANKEAGRNYAVPARAGGDDGLADLALQKLYEFSGSEAPAEGKERDRQRDKVAEVLKAYGCADAPPKVVEEAACLHCAAKGEFVNVYYTSFPADFGKYLGQARASHKKKDDYRVRVTEANEEAQAALEAKPKPPLRERTIWDNVLDALATQVGRNEFRTYLADTWLIGQENGTLRVAVGSAFDKDWIENRLGLTIKRALAGLANAPGGIVFEVES